MPASGIECAKFYKAFIRVVVDIAAKLVCRCFDFKLCLANHEKERMLLFIEYVKILLLIMV